MTPRDLTYEALSYILPSNSADNQATIALASARQLARIASDLTATLQDIYRKAPGIFKRTLSGTLAAPQTVSMTVTANSTAITLATDIQEGATILIAGDAVYNRVFTENAVKRLLHPYTGSSGTVAATLYGDCFLIDSTVSKVSGPVFIANGDRLVHKTNAADFYGGVTNYPDYGRNLRLTTNKPTHGTPRHYMVESFLLTAASTGHVQTHRIRVNPIPTAAIRLEYGAQLRAPTYAVADLGTDGADSTKTLVVADQYHESLLRPLFLERWSGSPWFRDEVARKQIKEDAAAARVGLVPASARELIAPL